MRIPSRGLAKWAQTVIAQCSSDRSERIQRGVAYRNLFLVGSEDGVPQTFLRVQDYILDLLSFLYSPADLRFAIDYYGQVSPAERAKAATAAPILLSHIRSGDVDTACRDAVLWSLIKGKTFLKLNWSRQGFDPYLIQPETFGVLRPDITDLKRQEAFVHTTFYTRSRFMDLLLNANLPDARINELMKEVDKYSQQQRGGEAPDQYTVLKQMQVGGLYPYQAAGNPQNQSGGVANWLLAPQPTLRADVIEKLIPYDELWVWDTYREDWATISMVGDTIVFGGEARFNAFSEQFKSTGDEENPLKGRHPFIEFCPYRMDAYFWGYSAVAGVALLQRSINRRIDGISNMLRKEEDPPRFMSGSTSINANAYAKLNRPGGYWTDGNPNAKIQDLQKEIPGDLWRSFHELNAMFDLAGGFPAATRGEGEGSVRSQGHFEGLLRTGAARHKDPSLMLERSIEEVGALGLDILKAKDTTPMTAWLMPGIKSLEVDRDPNPALEPPAPGMQPVTFQFHHLADNAKVTTDGHSQSPAFRQEARELAFALNQRGAMPPKRLVEATAPANADAILEDIERSDIEKAELIRQHPELLTGAKKGRPAAH